MDDKTLRAYLLGDLPEKKQEEIDGWLLVEEDAYDLLIAAEDDLIEDSLSGKLTAHELERLNSHFLVSEERQRKLQFGRTFHKFVRTANQPKSNSSFWETVLSIFKFHSAFAYSMSALFVLLIIGNVLLFSRTSSLQLQLADASLQREDMVRQLELRQAQLRSYGKVITAEQPLLAIQTTSLSPLILRSAGDIPKIEISSNTHVFKFALQLLDDSHFDSYKAGTIRS
jgi:hypothetical protein